MKKLYMPNFNQPKFIVVDVSEITRRCYFERMEFDKSENVLEIFDEKNIPRKFQKLIIYVKPLFKFNSAHDYYEYTLGFPFYLNIINDEDNKEKKYLDGQNDCVEIYRNLRVYNKIGFRTEYKAYSEEAINNFFKEMNDNGYLELYLECIKDLFWKVSFNEMLDSWKEQKKRIRK